MTPAMPDPIIIELGFKGIIAPTDRTKFRLPCPDCTPLRQSRASSGGSHKCMKVKIKSPTEAAVKCYNCSPEWVDVLA